MAVIQYHGIQTNTEMAIFSRVRPYDALGESVLPRYILGDKFNKTHEIRHKLPNYFVFGESFPRSVVAVYTSVGELEGQIILEFQGVVVE